jgi:hypothetical protein
MNQFNFSPFALTDEPVDYQLTVHYNNYNEFSDFIKDYESVVRYYLAYKEMPLVRKYGAMVNFVTVYGVGAIDNFLTEFKMRRSA